MAGGTLWIKVLPEKGTEAAIQQAVQKGGKQAEGSGKDSGGRWGLGFAAAAGVAIGRGLQQATALEQVEVGLTTMLGSAGEAREMLGDLTDFARNTPFEMQGLAANARQLLGVGAAADDVIPTLQTLGDASAALGLNQEQMDRVLRAVTQSMAKGKFQAEEMMQMAEAGIPIYDLMARAVGKSVPEMQEMAKNGELLSGDVLPKLLAVMQEDYAGGMVAQSKTLNGVLSTVKDDINLGLAAAVEFLIPLLADFLPSAAGAAGGAINVFGVGLRVAVTLVTPLLNLLELLMDGFAALPTPIQTAVVAALLLGRVMGAGGLIANLFTFGKALIANRTQIVENARAADTFRGSVGAVGKGALQAAGKTGLGALAGALVGGKWGLAAIGIGLVVTAIVDIANNAEGAREKIDALVGSVDFGSGGAPAAVRNLRDEIASLNRELAAQTGAGRAAGLEMMFSDLDEQADAARDKIEELERAQARYGRNSDDLAESLGITVGELERLALAAGLDLNLLAGDREDVAVFVAGLREANAAVEGGWDPTTALGEAMTTLGDEAATAADKTDALKTALEVLAGNKVGVLEATAQWQEALAGLAEAMQTTDEDGNTILNDLALAAVDAAGNLDLTSEAGRGLQEAVLTAAEGMRTSAAAARDQALANGDVAGAAAAAGAAANLAREDFIKQAMDLNLTREQAQGLADTYGLIPGQVVTAVAQPGMTAAQLNLVQLQTQLAGLPPNTPVRVTSLTEEATARLEALGFKVTHMEDGTVMVSAPNAAAVGAMIDTAARDRVATITVRSRGSGLLGGNILEAEGGRLEFYANGGMRAAGHALTPMRANWAQVVPADTWRVIGDRARGREWYIPEHAANTLPVLQDAAAAHGLQLVRAMAEGGLLGSKPVTVPVGASRVTNIENNLYATPMLPTVDQLQRVQRESEVLAGA